MLSSIFFSFDAAGAGLRFANPDHVLKSSAKILFLHINKKTLKVLKTFKVYSLDKIFALFENKYLTKFTVNVFYKKYFYEMSPSTDFFQRSRFFRLILPVSPKTE
jgi:hypothetical protein